MEHLSQSSPSRPPKQEREAARGQLATYIGMMRTIQNKYTLPGASNRHLESVEVMSFVQRVRNGGLTSHPGLTEKERWTIEASIDALEHVITAKEPLHLQSVLDQFMAMFKYMKWEKDF